MADPKKKQKKKQAKHNHKTIKSLVIFKTEANHLQ